MTTRAATFAIFAVAGLVVVITAGVFVHARSARAHSLNHRRALGAFVRATGLTDPCLSTSSRWNRTPSLAGPEAALADAPGLRDLDPAGSLVMRGAP
jgi:hypothetical protein